MAVDQAFWDAQMDQLNEVIKKWAEAGALGGITEGRRVLTPITGVDFGLMNNYARAWAVAHSAEVAASITQTNMDAFVSNFTDWVASGKPLPDMVASLKSAYGDKADMIAATETTRAFAEGNKTYWGSVGVEKIKWHTAADELVCEECGPLDGQVFPIDEAPPCPAHPRCRCWLMPELEKPGAGKPGEEEAPAWVNPKAQWGTDKPDSRDIYRGMLNERNWMQAGSPSPQAAKSAICGELYESTGIREDIISDFIHQWANTSNDTDLRSLQIQKVASEIFNSPMSEWQQKRLSEIMAERATYKPFDLIEDAHFRFFGETMERKFQYDQYADSSDALVEKLLRAMYANTQEKLEAAGINDLMLMRGQYLPSEVTNEMAKHVGEVANITGNALESWTCNPETAQSFGTTVIAQRIPKERVIGSARSGFGCLGEWEFVVIGDVPGDEGMIMQVRR